jgi:hypothetical protein
MKEGTLSFETILEKKYFFDYSLGGYSHRERWVRTRRCFEQRRRIRFWKQHYYHWEEDFYRSRLNNPNILSIGSVNKAATYDSRVASSRQNSNAVIEIYHEGKTPGSVLCGTVYAHGCALLVCIRVYDAKKNPGGRTRYPENHWDSFFISPKCGKRMDLTGFPNSSPRGLNLK